MTRPTPRWPYLLGLIPLATAGFGTAPLFWWAAFRTRRPDVRIGAVVYTLALVTAVALSSTERDESPLFAVAVAILFLIGAGHAFTLTRALYPHSGGPSLSATGPGNEAAVEDAYARMEQRRAAQALLSENPSLARELRIGRPDLPERSFDDGGLIDINQVPGWVLTRELELSPELAAQIIGERDRRRGFLSVDEIAVFCSLPPGLLPLLQDRLIVTPVG
ncbi:hypothetical protein [Nocardia sp. CC227C]|uniref:hypothetical protein n=1 Tax=Nocardia sp. CC227C TaxID=3044562 RepID=UPI00278C8353|nr:hypothetical protein [Nocardia sp. CC227C]